MEPTGKSSGAQLIVCGVMQDIYPRHLLLNPIYFVAAFEDIVQRNVVEIRKYGFNEGAENELEDVKVEWTGIQFWQIVKALSESKSVSDFDGSLRSITDNDSCVVYWIDQLWWA